MEHETIVFIERGGKPVPAGYLRIIEDGRYSRSEFSYGKKYLQRNDAIAIDPVQLPLTGTNMSTPDSFDIFNGIRDAAPDAWGRKLIDLYMMKTKKRIACEAEYLLVSQQGNRVGALQFGPDTTQPGPVVDIRIPSVSTDIGTLEGFQEMIDLVGKDRDIPDHLLDYIAPGSDLGGARPKGTVMIDNHPWLCKFGLENDRINMAAVEAGCLDLCEMAGIDVCERRIINIVGRPALMLKRFDRTLSDDGELHRRHMISGLTMLGAHEMDHGMSGYADLFNALRCYGSGSNYGETVYRRMVMNVLCGNTDDHYRNHACLLGDDGYYEPSPVYDVTPSLAVSLNRKLYFHPGKAGSGRDATIDNAALAAPSFGISLTRGIEITNELGDITAQNWRRIMSERGCSERDIAILENSFSEAGKQATPPDPFGSESDDETPENEYSIR